MVFSLLLCPSDELVSQVKALWKTDLSNAGWPKNIGKLPTSIKICNDLCGLAFPSQTRGKEICIPRMFHGGKRGNVRIEGAAEDFGYDTHPDRRAGHFCTGGTQKTPGIKNRRQQKPRSDWCLSNIDLKKENFSFCQYLPPILRSL